MASRTKQPFLSDVSWPVSTRSLAPSLDSYTHGPSSAKGAAAVSLINQALDAVGVYVFGELMDMPNIQELSSGSTAPHFNLLNIFAYGTYKDYKENKDTLPELSPAQLTKLRHLTIVSLATKNKRIPYSVLLQELDILNLRALEDLIIEGIYTDVIGGKLDQKKQQLEVDYAIGRDIRPESVSEVVNVLQEWYLFWCNSCEAVLQGIEAQIAKANQHRDSHIKLNKQWNKRLVSQTEDWWLQQRLVTRTKNGSSNKTSEYQQRWRPQHRLVAPTKTRGYQQRLVAPPRLVSQTKTGGSNKDWWLVQRMIAPTKTSGYQQRLAAPTQTGGSNKD
ncbi:hypothetical protein ScPMuIL_008698 [Solemya velum]